MVEKPVKLSSKDTKALASRNLKVCGKKGAFPSRLSDSDLAKYLSDAEVGGYLNTTKEFLLNKIAWEMMNPDYQKKKPTTVKKKDPVNKTAPSKKTSATRTESNAESENKKRPSADINYDILDELFNDENSPKRSKLEKTVVESSEECLLKPQGSEEEEEADCNEGYNNEDAYEGVEEFDGEADLEYEDHDEGDYNEVIDW
ncbi:unnamed protein product [Microthlaspi erraticum]|uniref:Brf1 TBP-binding domain-containing protein n=1 Tax=Microthlaspi erraticum TaxID=1685480 RepID=A0A6D2KP92_9BRAS|nr:unnamed protein product [Microthlaspi erraticum]